LDLDSDLDSTTAMTSSGSAGGILIATISTGASPGQSARCADASTSDSRIHVWQNAIRALSPPLAPINSVMVREALGRESPAMNSVEAK
jgi:hypothetical protein